MDIFRDLKNKNFDYSNKINTNKYTQSENKISNKQSHTINNINSQITNSIIEQVYVKETYNAVINNVINEPIQLVNESIQHAVDNECVKYTKQEQSKKYKTVYELILSIKDPKYNILEEKEKDTYSKEEKLKLCSLIDSEYDNYNFNKKMLSKSLICSNLQKLKDNYLSLILFYNEYFKINLVIFRQNNYYRTGLKNYDNVYVTFNKGKWSILTNLKDNIVFSCMLSELNTSIDCDVKSNFIYNQYLKAISHYKLDQLVEIANGLNIELKNNNKKKTKKELYEEINFNKL
jgi:hypothetical protein